MASMPSIPPRPMRSQKEHSTMSQPMDTPSIPPRPARVSNRAPSPGLDSFAPSPLNQTAFPVDPSGGIYNSIQHGFTANLPQRPPSVNLPSIGQEGSEYANLIAAPGEADGNNQAATVSPQETRNVGSDMKLYAPKPALPFSSAKARISTVTRTDSKQAAAAGIGKAHSDDSDPQTRSLRTKPSFASQDPSNPTDRSVSVNPPDDEHGIPEIGQRVPMYPNAGDVQAPSPSPYAQSFPAGIGSHHDGYHHGRQRGGKEHLPPGSYGLHGHGTPAQDRFEKAWYEKHPDALEREERGEYGPGIGGGRREWAMSSDDLNKIVRDTANRGAGLGTSSAVASTPTEQIGYIASEEYASRLATPRPASGADYNQTAHSNASQTHMDSPLRKASTAADLERPNDGGKRSSDPAFALSENVIESETEEDVIHVDAPGRAFNKIGGGGYDPPTEDLGPYGGNTEEEGGFLDERGYGTPILASDEISKVPGAEFLQPAIEPHQERRGSDYYAGPESDHPQTYMTGHVRNGSRGSSLAGSRPTSRAGGAGGGGLQSLSALSRFTSRDDREEVGTPLEDVKEYEPLFPEDEHESPIKSGKEEPLSAAERLKRHEMSQQKFPSKDIWEDSPSSAQLSATVSTPDLPPTKKETGEIPSLTESQRVTGEDDLMPIIAKDADSASFLDQEAKSNKSGLGVRDEASPRSGSGKQRFPSQDIWEDTPSSLQLQTTVATPEANGRQSPSVNSKPSIPARPTRSADRVDSGGPFTQTMASGRPVERGLLSDASPIASPTDRKAPGLPDRPKPQVPARPAKLVGRDSVENVPLSKTTSTNSSKSVDDSSRVLEVTAAYSSPKPKPAVPLRPSSGKIASLKAGFMSDLDKRLQMGPQGPKPKDREETEETEKEATPLTDARKGRARGPARRKPAASPTGTTESSTRTDSSGASSKLGLVCPSSVWQIAKDGIVRVHSVTSASGAQDSESVSRTEAMPKPTMLTRSAGETVEREDDSKVDTMTDGAHDGAAQSSATVAKAIQEEPEPAVRQAVANVERAAAAKPTASIGPKTESASIAPLKAAAFTHVPDESSATTVVSTTATTSEAEGLQ